MRPSFSSLILLVTSAVGLAACGSMAGMAPRPRTLEAIAVEPPTGSIAQAQPIARLPPEAGAIVAIRETRRPLGLSREIEMAGDSRASPFANHITMTLSRGEPGPAGPGWPGRPSQAGIAAELAARFPGMAMTVSPIPGRNAHGAYGRAVGRRADGLRCLYAWQWIDAAARDAGEPAHASIRVTLCSMTATLDTLASHVDRLALGPPPAIVAAAPPPVVEPQSDTRTAPPNPLASRLRRPRQASSLRPAPIIDSRPARLSVVPTLLGDRHALPPVAAAPAGPAVVGRLMGAPEEPQRPQASRVPMP